jgi:hypothetical protein
VVDIELLPIDEELMSLTYGKIHQWHLPTLVLSSGRTSLADKFEVCMFAFFLVAYASIDAYTYLCQQALSVCTADYGVEFSLPRVMPVALKTLFPFLVRTVPPTQYLCDDDFVDIHAVQDDPLDVKVGMDACIETPGPLHILHNAADRLLTYMPLVAAEIDALAEICSLLSHEHTRGRLIATCFSCELGVACKWEIEKFTARVNRKRWGTVAFAMKAVLAIMIVLRRFFNLSKYMAGCVGHERIDEASARRLAAKASEMGVKILIVSDAIDSNRFWGIMVTGDMIFSLVRVGFGWLETCPCHGHLNLDDVDSATKARWFACYLRGYRLPEIAAGDFLELFRSLFLATTGALIMGLPNDMDRSEKSECVKEFEHGRAGFLFEITLKVSAIMEPPCLLFACAHPKVSVSIRAMKVCMVSSCKHKRILELQSSPLKEESEVYTQGIEPLVALPDLQIFVCRFKWGYGTERLGEGGHSKIHRRAGTSRVRSEGFDSLGLRFPHLRTQMENESYTESFATILSEVRNPRMLVERLGLKFHDSVLGVKSAWDKQYRKVVYHADAGSLYARPTLVVDVAHRATAATLDPVVPDHVVAPSESEVPAHRVFTSENFYDELRRSMQLKFLLVQMKDVAQAGAKKIFSCRLKADAIQLLSNMLSNSGAASSGGAADLMHFWEDKKEVGHLASSSTKSKHSFFMVCNRHPATATRAIKGDLEASDFGIQILPYKSHDFEKGIVTLGSTPVTFEAAAVDDLRLSSTSLVLNIGSLDLSHLNTFVCWDSVLPIGFAIVGLSENFMSDDEGDVLEELVWRLTSSPRGYVLPSDGNDIDQSVAHLLARLAPEGIVACEQVEGGHPVWSLTAVGHEQVKSHIVCSNPKSRLFKEPRSGIDMKDMFKFELLVLLEHGGWICRFAKRRHKKAEAKANPYNVEATKVWYVSSVEESDIHRHYLLCLLLAEEHRLPVPHFAGVNKYKTILEPDWNPKTRAAEQVSWIPEGEWDVPPESLRMPKRARVARAVAVKPVPRRGAAVVEEGSSSNSDSDDCNSSSKSGSSNSSGSSSSGGSKTKLGGEVTPPVSEPVLEPPAAPAPKSTAAKAKAKALAEVVGLDTGSAVVVPSGGHKSNTNRLDCGLNFLTQRVPLGIVTGYQMTCTHPDHKGVRGQKCTKELSATVAGSLENARRMLKTWAIYGSFDSDQLTHRQATWDLVKTQFKDGLVPTEAELDGLEVYDRSNVMAPVVGAPIASSGASSSSSVAPDSPLEGPNPGVPAVVHDRMLALHLAGVLPRTTMSQRLRQRKVVGTTYGVPASLSEAFDFAYINPNLPPPAGYKWRHGVAQWRLCELGG